MPFVITTATQRIAALKKRIRAIQGGTSAGKTIGILEVLIDLAQSDKKPTITSICSESFPHLRRGAMRDFINIMQTQGYYDAKRWNKTESIYEFETGSLIEFFSVDQSDKVRGPRRDRLFGNEVNNWQNGLETFEQLEIRTNEFVIMDWNPTNEFWFYDKIAQREDVEHIILTYKDNEALPDEIRKSIEMRRDRKDWWKVYGEGQLGEVEGKIYKDWQIIDDIPHVARPERDCLDYGYTNDPSAGVRIYYHDGGYILDELLYARGLSNRQIGDVLLNQPLQLPVVPDSSEPKSNDELKSFGLTVIPAEKGPDSVRNGIQLVQAQRISVTKRSVNIIKEYRNYLWEVDRDGKILNIPEHTFSHSMDAIRYGLTSILKKPKLEYRASSPAQPYYGDEEMPF